MNRALSIFSLLCLGFAFGHIVGYNRGVSKTPQQCEAPVSMSTEPVETGTAFLTSEVEKWHVAYEKMEDQWLTCTRDLARVSDECNADIICVEQVCERR